MNAQKLFALVFLLFASPAAAAEPAIPDTPAGHMMSDFLTAFGVGSRASLEAFNTKYHRDRPVDGLLSFREQTGGITLLMIETDTPNSATAFVREKEGDAIYRLGATIASTKPNGEVYGDVYMAGDVPHPTQLDPARMSQKEALAALDARADALVARDRFSGDMLVARHGKIVFEKSWGLANRETHTPIDAGMRFRLGSMCKMFTAVAVLQLVSQGKLSLDGTVGQYLPDYPNKDIAAKVTVRELLNHTAGVGDIFGPEFDAHRMSLKTVADYVALYGARGPEHEPGASDGYDNYGFVLLGAIVERVSGKSYYDYVDNHIFRPAGMTQTGSLPDDGHIANLAPGYMRKDGAWVPNTDTLPYRGSPAGGGYSTLGNLLKFAQALQSGTLAPRKLLAEATSPQTHGRWYGYGFEVQADHPPRHYGHSGGAPGMNGEMRIFPDQDVVVVALSNEDYANASTLVEFYSLRMPIAP